MSSYTPFQTNGCCTQKPNCKCIVATPLPPFPPVVVNNSDIFQFSGTSTFVTAVALSSSLGFGSAAASTVIGGVTYPTSFVTVPRNGTLTNVAVTFLDTTAITTAGTATYTVYLVTPATPTSAATSTSIASVAVPMATTLLAGYALSASLTTSQGVPAGSALGVVVSSDAALVGVGISSVSLTFQ